MCQQAGVSRGQKEFEREANTAVNSIGATVSFSGIGRSIRPMREEALSGIRGGRFVLILDSSQFFTQTRSFVAILCRVHVVLDGGDAADRIENLGDRIVFAFAGMF
jgi:hypothetical protein